MLKYGHGNEAESRPPPILGSVVIPQLCRSAFFFLYFAWFESQTLPISSNSASWVRRTQNDRKLDLGNWCQSVSHCPQHDQPDSEPNLITTCPLCPWVCMLGKITHTQLYLSTETQALNNNSGSGASSPISTNLLYLLNCL